MTAISGSRAGVAVPAGASAAPRTRLVPLERDVPLADPGFVHLVRWALTARLVCLALAAGSTMSGAALSVPGVVAVLVLVVGSFVVSRSEAMIRALLRRSILASVDIAFTVLLLVSVPDGGPAALNAVCSALLAGLLFPRRVLVVLMVPLVLGTLYAPGALLAGRPHSWHSVLVVVAGLPVLTVGVCTIGAAVRHSFEAVLRARSEVAEAVAAVGAAQERARLARDMHDSVGKSLHGMSLAARALARTVERDPASAAALARSLGDAAEQAGLEARTLLRALREGTDDRPTVDVLAEVARGWQAETGVETRLATVRTVDASPAVTRELAAVLGEVLHNVAKHAGASRVDVTLTGTEHVVELAVRDDGAGFDTGTTAAKEAGGHFGLRGLAERAEQVGGALSIDSRPGEGTTVRWTAPRFPTSA